MTVPERLRSRKLWAWVVMTALATFMRYDEMIEADHWERVVTWVTMAYVGVQMVQDTWGKT